MKMDSSTTDVGSTEDIVKGLLEYLVAPLLPLNTSSARATPSASQQESVAKQMHATVLLYNYYQRKRHPELQFLDFESFSKLAVALKPSLMLHMKFTHHLDLAKLDDLENQLSPTETAIMNACSVSRTLLDASKDHSSSFEEWPIIKVAVLLIDSTKENCLLTFGSITNGVWSVIEKDLDPENLVVSSLGENEADDEAGFQRVAFSAVKEKAGIGWAELKILESNVTFTTSKEKTATRFYIMQCTQPNRKFLRVPIKDAIDSLQGPLVERSSGSWRVTPVVEYFHLLPYAPIVSRVFHLNSMEDSVGKETVDVNFYQSSVKPCEKENGKAEGVFPKTLGDVKVGLDSDVKVGLDSLEIDTPIMDKLSENHISDAIDSSDKSCLALDVGKEAVPVNLSEVTENPCDMEVIISKSSSDKEANVAVGFPKQKDCEGSDTIDLSNSKHFFGAVREEASQYIFDTCRSDGKKRKSFTDPPSFSSFKELTSALHSTDINENPAVGPAKESVNNSGNGIINVYQYQKRRTPSVPLEERCKNASTNGTKTKAPLPVSDLKIGVVKVNTESCISDGRDASVASEKMTSVVGANSDGIQKVDHSLVPFEPKGIYHEKFRVAIAEKETALSQTALRALNMKKEKLTNQLHNLKDEITLCERNIQAILDGAENNFSIKLEAIIDCCNDVCLQNKTQAQYRINQQADAQDLHQNQLGKRLSETILIQRTSCQELDDICCANNWMLPKYSVFPSEGGFLAYVIMKGLDFECSSETDRYPSPHEARNAAAKQMIAKLCSMANQVQ